MDNAFGKRLRILRKEHHITQVQLAERMDQTESNIRNYELGKAFPRIPALWFCLKCLVFQLIFFLAYLMCGMETEWANLKPLFKHPFKTSVPMNC